MIINDFDNEFDNIHAQALRNSSDFSQGFFEISYFNCAKILVISNRAAAMAIMIAAGIN